MLRLASLIFVIIPLLLSAQKRTFTTGDKVNISVDLYDHEGTSQPVPVPGDQYTLLFNYKWDDDQHKDTQDSIRQVEKIISKAVKKFKVQELRVICYSFDKGSAFKLWKETISASKPFTSTPHCKAEYYNTNDYSAVTKQMSKLFSRINLVAPDGKLIAKSNSLMQFENDTVFDIKSSTLLRARLMVDSAGLKFPLIRALVCLFGNKSDTLEKAMTDDHGDFEIPIPDDEQSTYEIKIKSNAQMKDVTIVERDGTEIGKMNKTDNGFTYRLLKADITRLTEIPEKDENIGATYKRFMTGNKKVLRVVEYVNYELGKYSLNKEAESLLDQIVVILKENPQAKLEVISHTDAQGVDAVNLSLSEKRSHAVVNYLVSKGIQKKRLKAIGKGETVIRNRCLNGVNCSDEEHAFNRRTEFNFTKQ